PERSPGRRPVRRRGTPPGGWPPPARSPPGPDAGEWAGPRSPPATGRPATPRPAAAARPPETVGGTRSARWSVESGRVRPPLPGAPPARTPPPYISSLLPGAGTGAAGRTRGQAPECDSTPVVGAGR